MGKAMTTRDVERRHLAQPVEWRAAGDSADSVGKLGGYAAVYNRYSQNLGGYVECVAPGAFTKSLSDGVRVLCRYNHKDDGLLGTSDAETLRLNSDDVGLDYEVDLPDTSTGRDAAVLAKRGDLRFSSFAFICIEEEWGVTEQGFPLRTILQAQLIDVAPVVNPAYLDSSTGMRSLAAHLGMDVTTVAEKSTEELRALLTGEPGEAGAGNAQPSSVDAEVRNESTDAEQVDNHSAFLAIEQRRLKLDALK